MTDQEIHAALHSFECSCTNECEGEMEKYDNAVAAREEAESQRAHTPERAHAEIMNQHNRTVDGHERRMRSLARRAEAAKEGLFLHSPDEGSDAEHMRRHGPLRTALARAGRVRYTNERSGDPFP